MRKPNRNSALRLAGLSLAILALLTPTAHVLELPNKLNLSGPLWLALQQHLYRGWGPYLGGPSEIGAFGVALVRLFVARQHAERRWSVIAALAYAGMIGVFFALNDPVNRAISGWSPATIPPNWEGYRLRWEAGHAVSAVLAVIGLVAAVLAHARDNPQR